ncbi:hypothetical protein BB561_005402 [Smittium simulii]|uniref:Structural maintenance of chromosomes protein n=1 Tax=Smittium simulii TaxID=133385 RepID=A0A2T9YAQ0_9FUNG|nr:hypothetical protein BB561_005402 [Smittium simulii]
MEETPDLNAILRPTSRLVITKMVLENFKSYAGQQIIGPFHKSFSAIVGPNGSGKSNVIDSLLFVFGFRASKIRQSKLSDLIHSSKNGEKYTQCSVAVHFVEIPTDKNPLDENDKVYGSDIILTRTAFSNNTSKYYLNGNVTTLAEVTELLKSKGIDLNHKRFLILQVIVYFITIQYYNKLVDELNDSRAEKLRRVNLIEREKNNLEAKKNEAVSFITLENDLALKKNTNYQFKLFQNQNIFNDAQSKYELVKNKFDEENKKTFAIKEEIRAIEDSYKKILKEYEAMEKNTKEVAKHYSRAEREELTFSVNTNIESIKRAEADMEKEKIELSNLEKKLAIEKIELSKIVDTLKGKTESLTENLREKQQELEPWKEKISTEKSKLAVIATETELIQAKYNNASDAIFNAEKELMELRKQRATKDKEMNNQVEEYANLEEQAISIKNKLNELYEAEKELASRYQQALQAEEDAKNSLNNTQSQSAVLTSLLKEKDLGRISGIYGRLGNLGTIDDSYDIAISTACPGLESIVVQNVTSGQKCVEFLRRNNIGRAKFIMLDELPKFDITKKNLPENSQRLFDLVKPSNPRFAPAFFHALGNTLVTKNLEQARLIAYGASRNRVVTLDGKLIDASGTMSGGGFRVMKGAMSSKPTVGDISPQKLQQLTQERQSAETETRNFDLKIENYKNNLKEVNSRHVHLEQQLPKSEMDLKNIDDLVKECKKQLNTLKETVSEGPTSLEQNELNNLNKKSMAINETIEKLQEECSTVEEAIKDLNDKIMQAGGVKLRTQTNKVDSIGEQIALLSENIDNYESNLNKNKSELTRLQKSISKNKEEQDTIQTQLEVTDDVLKRQKVEMNKISLNLNNLKQTLEDKKDQLDTLKSQLDNRQDEFNEIKNTEEKLKMEIDDTERAVAEGLRKTNYWKSELSRLKLQQLPPGIELAEPQPESLPQLLPEALNKLDLSYLEKEIRQISDKIQMSKPNLSVLAEYSKRVMELNGHTEQLSNITLNRDEALKNYNNLHTQRLNEFISGFNTISYKLKEMYQLITMGGSAELELVDSLDPFIEGIVFSVMPPKKSWKNISDLSGGEKTLSSLALVFALHMYKPTPIYVMDEIDAALDFRNVSIIGNYIKQRTKNAQFVVISLRNNMFELADWLVGIYKTDNKTKSITFNPSKTEKVLRC